MAFLNGGPARAPSLERQASDRALAPGPAVSVRDAWFAYRKGQPVLRGVSLEATPGSITAVLGASGSGKTTLFRLVKGLERPARGAVTVLGGTPGPHGWRLDARIAYIPQQLGLVRNRSVLENTLTGALSRVSWWRGLAGRLPADVVAEARETLASLGIPEKAGERVRALSGGQRQRVAIARALMQRPSVILADEFVSQLDAHTTRETLDLVRAIAARGVTVLVNTHELELVAGFADSIVVLRDGAVTLGGPADAFSPGDLAEAMR